MKLFRKIQCWLGFHTLEESGQAYIVKDKPTPLVRLCCKYCDVCLFVDTHD